MVRPGFSGRYTEGLVAAFKLARLADDRDRAERYGKALAGCVRYLLALQFKEEDVFWMPRPEKVLGALATKPSNNELRLDFTYHGISAIHALTKILSKEEWERLK